MTPRLRTALGGVRLMPARLLLVLAALLLPCGTAAAHEPEPKPSDSTGSPASPAPSPSLAGTVAGEGRIRPGRPEGPAVAVEGDDDPDTGPDDDPDDDPDGTTATKPAEDDAGRPSAGAAQPPRDTVLVPAAPQPPPVHQAIAPGQDDGTEPVLDILPLGSGLVLIGLGFGLAFIGLRVRRS